MDPLTGRRRDILEAMESCRANAGDLNDAQFAELAAALDGDSEVRARFDRLQRSDAAIKEAFSDVSLPADLAERVSRRLSEAVNQPVAVVATAAEIPHDSPALLPVQVLAPRPRLVSRRRVMVGFAGLAVAAAVATVVWLHNHRTPPLSSGQVIEVAMDFFGRDNAPPGELVSRVAPPSNFPISPDIARFKDVRWRRVENFADGEAIAYDLPSRGGRATLYVANRTVAGLPPFPPPQPTLSTGGNSVAAWQSGGLLYVLVVQGDAQTYSDYLDRSQGPLT
jgi:hypothetical protein